MHIVLFLFIFMLQSFIDKFRYNAKRASLVQSRIKVLFTITSNVILSAAWTPFSAVISYVFCWYNLSNDAYK